MSEFDERMLFEPLDGEPDPTFEAALLVRLQDELTAPTSHPSTEPTSGRVPEPEVEIVMLKPNDLKNRPRPWLALVAAAIVLIVGVAALWPSDEPPVVTDQPDDTTDVVETDPAPEDDGETSTEATSDVDVAMAFMTARASGDAAAIQSVIAPDADIVYRMEWIRTADEYPALLEWEAIAGVTFDDIDCADGSPGRVRCTYLMTTHMAAALGYDGWTNSFVFDIDDGIITAVNHTRTELQTVEDSYHLAVFATQFGPWVDNTYPGDWETLTAEPDFNEPRSPHFTDEALALWQVRIPEFIAHLDAERVAVAEAFMTGRGAYDAAAVRAVVDDETAIVYSHEWIDDPADYDGLIEWERIAGVAFDDVSCAPGSPGRVRCSYSMTTAMSRALGFEPYPNHFLFDIEDGLINAITHRRAELTGIIPQDDYRIAVYFNNFAPWVDTTHPGDWETLTTPPRAGNDSREFVFTDEALALWEIRIPEFIASLENG